ncbi:MAG: hypothetical protein K2Q09_05380, partial [Phycisphaerales bacterium]|nr:hypothetical protein [Phycisphaerales bacterium]
MPRFMRRGHQTCARVVGWLLIGLLASWVQAGAAAWLCAPPGVAYPVYPGYPIGTAFDSAGNRVSNPGHEQPTRSPRDLGVLGRAIAEAFFHGQGTTVFAVGPSAAERGGFYMLGVERHGWP